MNDETDEYLLGTHDEELDRLGLQHRVWRPRATDAWRRAGFTLGQTIIDVGCGPGFASLDLAEVVGPAGQIFALDKSRRFLDYLGNASRARGLANIRTIELDLDESKVPVTGAHGAWSRWASAFVTRPRELLRSVCGALRDDATLVFHEYLDYSTWRLAPAAPEFEEFREAVTRAWRAGGGEPDIALYLPGWLKELGFEVRSMLPLVDAVTPSSFVWEWPKSFVQVGLDRMLELGHMTQQQAAQVRNAFDEAEQRGMVMVTPMVLEIIAVRGRGCGTQE